MKHITIGEGVTLHVIPETKFKTTNLTVTLLRPLCKEEATKNSLIPSVLRRGCRKYPTTKALNLYLDELYGASFAYGVKKQGAYQRISLHFKTVADRYADGAPFSSLVTLATDILFDPLAQNDSFDAEVVAREKDNLREYIESIANDKKEYAKNRLAEEMFKGDPYSIFEYGRIEDLESIDARNLYAHFKKVLSESTVHIFLTGEADENAVANTLRAAFDTSLRKTRPALCVTVKQPGEVRVVEETQAVTQGKLAIGYIAPVLRTDPGYYAMMVFCNLFGGAPHSKLFLNVREKLSLAYYASSVYDSFKGVLAVHCGIESKNYEVTRQEIAKQLTAMQQGDFTEEEVQFSVLALCNMYESAKDSADAMEAFYAGQMLLGTDDSIDSVIESLQKVTKQQVVDAAKGITLDTVYFLKGEA